MNCSINIVKCLLLVFLSSSVGACNGSDTRSQVVVSVAASLTDVMILLEQRYERRHPQVDIRLNTGGSSSLARQIVQGAPVDLFISANQAQMRRVSQSLTVQSETLLTSALVLATSRQMNRVDSLEQALSVASGQIGICESTVPCGDYARNYLVGRGQWKQVQARLVPFKHVKQVVRAIQSGNLESGFIYETELNSPENTLQLLFRPEAERVGPIIYSAAVLDPGVSRSKGLAQNFLEWLRGKEARAHFEAAGFGVLGGVR